MAKFWAERINYDLDKIDEVPNKLKDKVKKYIESETLHYEKNNRI